MDGSIDERDPIGGGDPSAGGTHNPSWPHAGMGRYLLTAAGGSGQAPPSKPEDLAAQRELVPQCVSFWGIRRHYSAGRHLNRPQDRKASAVRTATFVYEDSTTFYHIRIKIIQDISHSDPVIPGSCSCGGTRRIGGFDPMGRGPGLSAGAHAGRIWLRR